MDAIADRAFSDSTTATSYSSSRHHQDETPSLLTVLLDINPLEWKKLSDNPDNSVTLKKVMNSLLVMLNSHLSLNSSNKVALYVYNGFKIGGKLIYPKIESSVDSSNSKGERSAKKGSNLLLSNGMYRQFRILDGSILDDLDSIIRSEFDSIKELINDDSSQHIKGTLSGVMSMALNYINKLKIVDELGTNTSNMKSRIMVINISNDTTLPYISIMNTIFASQKMKISIDVCKLGSNSTFLQQASDLTNGIYIYIKNPNGLIQYLTTALFIDPSLRPIIVLPTNASIDFRASCFITNKVIDIGYVCSVCLCILSIIPNDENCPTCQSKFDHDLIIKLKRKPKVLPLVNTKKRKM